MRRFFRSNAVALARTGTLVTMAWFLYRQHFATYLRLSVQATVWVLVPVLLGGVGVALGVVAGLANPLGYGLIPIAVLLGLGGLLVGGTQSLFLAALITRLGYHHLIQQPESVSVARRALRPRWLGFLGVQLLVSVALYVAQVVVSMPVSLISVTLVAVLSEVTTDPWLVTGVPMGLNLLVLVGYLWVVARLYIPDAVYAIEPTATVANSINRSWQLTRRAAIAILLVMSVAFLLVTPVYFLASTPFFLILGRVLLLFDQVTLAPDLFSQQLIGAVILASLIWALINVLILPFWQTLKSVLYYDLRLFNEGADLQLRDRPSAPAP